jgi:GT2 family glycosyltransferase
MKWRISNLVSVIIVNYNGEEYLEDCLASLRRQTYSDLEVILVDNASHDGSVRLVEQKFPEVWLIKSKENLGYAGGNNIGLRQAKGEYILILNNDTVLEKDAVESLIRGFGEIENLGAAQPKVLLMDEKSRLDSCGSFFTRTGFLYHYGNYKNADLEKYNCPFPVYSVKGVCMLVKREVIEKVGLFDGDFFCFFEESDFCHRVWLAGYECWYYPKAVIHHALGGAALKQPSSFVQYHSFKNRLCSYLKNLGGKRLVKVLPVYLTLNVLLSLVYLAKLEFENFLMIYKAFFWNLKNINRTLRKRKEIVREVDEAAIFKRVKKNPRLSYFFYLAKNDLGHYEDINH